MRLLLLLLVFIVLAKVANGIDDSVSSDEGGNKIKIKQEPIILSSFKKIKEETTPPPPTTTTTTTIEITTVPTQDQTIEQKREDDVKVNEEKAVVTEEVAPISNNPIDVIEETSNTIDDVQKEDEITKHMKTDMPQRKEEKDDIETLQQVNSDNKPNQHHHEAIEKNKGLVLDKQSPSHSSLVKGEGMVDRVIALIQDSALNELYSKCIATDNNISDGDNNNNNNNNSSNSSLSLSSGILCSEVEYALSLREMYTSMTQERGSSLIKSIPKTPVTVKPIGKDVRTEYASIFEEYIMKKRLFKDNMTADATAFHSVMEFCGTLGKGSEVPLIDCPNRDDLFHNSDFKLPAVVYNNYFVRLTNQLSEDNSNSNKIDLLNRWPSTVLLQSDTPTNVMTCPNNLHQVIWGVGNRKVTIRLFHKAFSFAFMPRLNRRGNLGDPLFMRHGFDESVDDVMDGGEADSIERLVGKVQANIEKPGLPKKFTEVTLQGNEYIFIPNSFLASIKLERSDGVKAGHVFRSCFLDASNMIEFRDALRHSSKVSSNDNIIYKAVSSADFYVSMERNPLEVDMKVYQMFPKPVITDVSTSESSKDSQPPPKKRERVRKNSVNFRDWQIINKWNFMITGLTIPQPFVASVVDIKRKSVKLSWKSPYLPNMNDKTKFGFNITICVEGYDIVDENKNCIVHNFERDTPNLIETKYDSNIDVPEYSVFSAMISGLTHDTNYRFRTIIYYNLATSTPSEWSSLIRTASLSEPGPIKSDSSREFDIVGFNTYDGILLKFTGPEDDGGVPIIGFHVYARNIEQNHFPSHWAYIGPFICQSYSQISQLEIKKSLFPDTIYEFRLSAFNNLGSGPISGFSNQIRTENITKDSTFLFSRPAFNFSHYPPIISENWKEEHLEYYKYNTSKIMTIDSSNQKLFTMENSIEKIDGWLCHWTPKGYSVVGQSVWANPSDANSDLINNNIIDGRIVWILRGKAPVITKALRVQAAGAIGIVLVDSGKCTTFDQKCIPGADKTRGEYFAQYDKANYWKDLKIPIIFILLKDANSFASKLNLQNIMDINEYDIKTNTMNDDIKSEL